MTGRHNRKKAGLAPPPPLRMYKAILPRMGGIPATPMGVRFGPRGPGDPGQAPPAKINPRGYPFQGVGKGQGDLARADDAG